MPKLSSCALAAPILAAEGPAEVDDESTPRGEEPAVLSGTVRVDSFEIPADQKVLVGDDLVLVSGSTIRIDGDLIARDRSGDEAAAGPRIELHAASEITIGSDGRVLGGRGAEQPDRTERGYDGSSITLAAPVVWIDGVARGGDGGAGSRGGDGGSVHIYGHYWTHRHFKAGLSWEENGHGAIGGKGGTGGSGLGNPGIAGVAGEKTAGSGGTSGNPGQPNGLVGSAGGAGGALAGNAGGPRGAGSGLPSARTLVRAAIAE
ncbi:MAG: hypothetical protein AAF682_01375 [Planctomycetota bacterium]